MVKTKIIKDGGNFTIQLTSAKLAKNVYLCVDEDEGFFTDNYFDLLPKETKIIEYKGEITLDNLQKNLKIISLADIYN